MGFVEDVKRCLRQGRAAVREPVFGPATARSWRAVALRALARLESADLPGQHGRWLEGERLERFVGHVARTLNDGLAELSGVGRLPFLVEAALHREITGAWPEKMPTLPLEKLEIDAAISSFDPVTDGSDTTAGRSGVFDYCAELRLVTPGGTLTDAGAFLLDLPGWDAVRWLLHLEVAQSTGPRDPLRLSAEVAAEVIACPEFQGESVDDSMGGLRDVPSKLVAHLDELHILVGVDRFFPIDFSYGWKLTPTGLSILQELIADPPVPMALLAEAMVRDMSSHTLAARAGMPTPVNAPIDAWIGFARRIAHEVRNGLAPVRRALERLEHVAQDGGAIEALGRARDGLDRVEEFARETLALSGKVEGALELVDVGQVAAAAVAATASDRNGHVRVELLVSEAWTRARRRDLVEVVVNLLRNACQAAGERAVTVQIRVHAEADHAVLVVDDDGPGIPAHLADRIFEAGVSGTGSSGLGLKLAKDTIDGLGGTVAHQPSERGGARFVVRLSLASGGPGHA